MKARIVASVWIYLVSLAALAANAVMLSMMLDAYAPLDAAHLGLRVPGFTRMVLADVSRYPFYMGSAGAMSLIGALYFWRRARPIEAKTYAMTFIAALNLTVATYFPMSFVIAYFLLPKAANSV